MELLLRFNFQPCSLAKPFNEQVVGFYVHTNMNFVVTERGESIAKNKQADAALNSDVNVLSSLFAEQ